MLSRLLHLNALNKDIEAIDGEAALRFDRELDVHLRPVPADRAHHAGRIGSLLANRVIVNELEATAGPGREGCGVERVVLEDNAELPGLGLVVRVRALGVRARASPNLRGVVIAPEGLVAFRHVVQAQRLVRVRVRVRSRTRVRAGVRVRVRVRVL